MAEERAEAPQVNIDNAETVNVPATGGHLPHARVVMGVTFAVITAFAVITIYVLVGQGGAGIDAATKGALIQTWNNLAIAAVMFWVGSSSAGKMAAGAGRP